ncbi:MAG: hypothetical protein FJ196_01985 [Gammaproteobacteria bacterium]|nr:hypothetical protein [Gammaproteobacteria bacterium]
MSKGDSEGFEVNVETLGEAVNHDEDSQDYDRFLDRIDRRARPTPGKRVKAAWSKLEEVLADKKLAKDLREYYDDKL